MSENKAVVSRAIAQGEAKSIGVPLRTTKLVKTFRQGTSSVRALNGVSLEVPQGQFTAIMGASGSGKSTLLHVMGGLARPDSGDVFVEGERLSSLPDAKLTDFRRRRIGLVFQQFNLIPALTAIENVMLPLMAGGAAANGKSREQAVALLERLGLGNRLTHRPDAMSGGEQQRVAIARALITDPAIVMADEPTGSLDSANGRAICELLKELNEKEGRTIVVVTHEPAVAAWAGRVVIMKDGAICTEWLADGVQDPHELAGRYQDIVSGSSLAKAT
ncbi:ABC transporter ATP-binding protein [Blastopirellula marina]|uniref:Putative ABC transport system ATP binding protein n=1 Tax=Blastopirellula marina DSM 3645 TaxID=314230 RepID=A3ZPC0_9BACT|nr:ABC transporter ATP-binding protein [Blastopirellula marina]EAQ81598.1 putative ABC transport system ATP binding protein [Blastopirellula marina DSM 3645]